MIEQQQEEAPMCCHYHHALEKSESAVNIEEMHMKERHFWQD